MSKIRDCGVTTFRAYSDNTGQAEGPIRVAESLAFSLRATPLCAPLLRLGQGSGMPCSQLCGADLHQPLVDLRVHKANPPKMFVHASSMDSEEFRHLPVGSATIPYQRCCHAAPTDR